MVTVPLVAVQEGPCRAGRYAVCHGELYIEHAEFRALCPLQLRALCLRVLQQSTTSTRPDLHLGLGGGGRRWPVVVWKHTGHPQQSAILQIGEVKQVIFQDHTTN